MTDPIPVGEAAEQTVGLLYHNQLIQRYHETSEALVLNAMVMLCLTARRFDSTVMYVLLDDSDQGSWQTVVGLAANVPQYAGHYSTELDRDPDDRFDDEGWASSIDDRTEDTWQVFMQTTEFIPSVKLLDVERVLKEIDLPWRPVPKWGLFMPGADGPYATFTDEADALSSLAAGPAAATVHPLDDGDLGLGRFGKNLLGGA